MPNQKVHRGEIHEHGSAWGASSGSPDPQGKYSISWVYLFALCISSCPVPELGRATAHQELSTFLSLLCVLRSPSYCTQIHFQYKVSKEEIMFDISPTLKNSLSSQPLWCSRRGEKRIKILPFFTQFSLGRLKISRFYPSPQEHLILREITVLHKRYFQELRNRQRNKGSSFQSEKNPNKQTNSSNIQVRHWRLFIELLSLLIFPFIIMYNILPQKNKGKIKYFI